MSKIILLTLFMGVALATSNLRAKMLNLNDEDSNFVQVSEEEVNFDGGDDMFVQVSEEDAGNCQ